MKNKSSSPLVLKFITTFCLLLAGCFGSISNQTNRIGPFIPNSLPATLSVTFPYQNASDLLVLDLGQGGTTRDPPVILTLNSDYTVTGGGYNSSTQMQSGNVVVVSTGSHGVVANDYIVILRNTPLTQTTVFSSTGILTGPMIEKALDKGITASQQLTEASGRSLRFESGETLDGTLTRSARAGKVLGFDATGAISYSTGGSGGGATYTAGAGLQLASNVFSVLPTQSFTDLTVTNPIIGGITGNAGTATRLATLRAINGVDFDGTSPITVTADAGTLTGTTLAGNVVSSGLVTAAVGTLGSLATQNANAVNITGGTINGATVTGLPAPSGTTDATTKAYVDSISAGIVPRSAVVVATTANITLSGTQTIDGQAVIAGNRVLVKNQTLPKENGIYDCAAGAWARSADSNTAGELLFGYYYFVSSGTTQGSTSWFIQTAPTVLNTDPVVFAQFSASQNYSAGIGLGLAGNVFSLTTPVAASLGGTGLSSYVVGDLLYANSGTTFAKLPAVATGAVLVSNGVGQPPSWGTDVYFTSLRTDAIYLQALFAPTYTTLVTQQSIITANRNLRLFTGDADRTLTLTGNATLNQNVSTTARPTFSAGLNLGTGSVGYTADFAAPAANMRLFDTGGSGVALVLESRSSSLGVGNAALGSGGKILISAESTDSATFTATGMNNTVIGTTTAAAGRFTTISSSSSANIRTTKGNFNTVINVKDYGALGDGSTNDTAAIATAKTAAIATSGILYFPKGIYKTDLISMASAVNVAVYGDGIGVSVIKTRTPSQVLNIDVASNHVTVHGLTFDGSCVARTAGQQAVVFNASQSSFTDNEIINSGEFAFYAGSGAAVTDLIVSRNYVHACYADGINFGNVQRGVISNNIVDGSDDDCIAVGYIPAVGVSTNINVIGNICRARTDLGTTWGRGILFLRATDCLAEGNVVDTVKQYGILIDNDGARCQRIRLIGNTVKNACINSGSAIAVYGSTDCTLLNNVVDNPASGNCLDIADWQNLTIQGGVLTQTSNVFARGIHADESAGSWAASWDKLQISNVQINMLGASTNSCVYLSPDASITMNTLSITGITSNQVNAGDYITVATARVGTIAKIGNNVKLNAANTVTPAATTGVITVFNNN